MVCKQLHPETRCFGANKVILSTVYNLLPMVPVYFLSEGYDDFSHTPTSEVGSKVVLPAQPLHCDASTGSRDAQGSAWRCRWGVWGMSLGVYGPKANVFVANARAADIPQWKWPARIQDIHIASPILA